MNHHRLNIFFSDKAGPQIFSAATFSNSIKILLSTITFDNPEERKKNYHMIPCEMLNCNTSKHLLPSLYLSIHETLCPIGNQIAFRQTFLQNHTNMSYYLIR